MVRAIHVHDGQAVNAGDPVIELDSTISEADHNRSKSDLVSMQLDIARLRAALANGDDPVADFHPPENASPDLVATEKQFLLNQVNKHRAKLAVLDRQEAQKEAERATIEATINKLQSTITVASERVDVRKHLFDKQLGSKLTYLTELQDLVSQQRGPAGAAEQGARGRSGVGRHRPDTCTDSGKYRRDLLRDLTTDEQKAASLQQDIIKAQEHVRLQRLASPIEGIVQQLAVHTIGGVVTPAQALLVVVPATAISKSKP